MGLRITIQDNFLDLAEAFKELSSEEIIKASRRALNRTLLTVRQESITQITKRVKVKPSRLRQRYIDMYKARGGSFNSMEASIVFSGEPIPFLEFVRGRKTPIEQKGIPVKRRRKLRVEITPGKRFVVRKAFIQRVSSLQVFKRKPQGGFAKQSAKSVAFMVLHRGIGERLVEVGTARLAELLRRELEFRLMVAQGKIRPSRG